MYWIMDGRAKYDIDRAIIYECCDTVEEALKNCEDYGDSVIVRAKTQEIVYVKEAK